MKRTCSVTCLKAVATLSLAALFAAAGCGDDSPRSSADGGADTNAGVASLTVTPSTSNFGSVVAGTRSTAVQFVVSNNGTGASGGLVVALIGPNKNEFEFTGNNNCTGPLAAGSTCNFSVVFAPMTADAAPKVAQVQVTGRSSESFVVGLTGLALAPSALTIGPNSQDFGSVVQDQASQPVEFTITNTGGVATGAPLVAIGGNDPAQFTITGNTCNAALAPAGTCKVAVRFNPTSVAKKNATLTAQAAPGGTATASLEGNGLRVSALVIGPTPQDFGTVLVNGTSNPIDFTVTNNGGVAATGVTVAIGGTNQDQYKIDATTSTCTDTIAAGATCKVTVRFAPTKPGTLAASLGVSTNPGGLITAALSGIGQAGARIAVTPTVLNFGTVVNGQTSASVAFTVTNLGGAPAGPLTAVIEGADASHFNIQSNGCNANELLADNSCTIELRFAPTTVGPKTIAQLKVSGTPGGTVVSNLSGTGIAVGQLKIEPSVSQFGNVVVGQTSTAATFTITNTGGSPTGVLTSALSGANPSEFPLVVAGNSCANSSLAAGASCTISVQFAPMSPGAKAASLTVAGTPGGATAASLSGTGLTASQIVVAPTQQDFGSVAQGQNSSAVSFTVKNNGQQTSGPIVSTLVGANADQFVIASTDCTMLAANDTCVVVARFAPTLTSGVGPKNAQLNIVGTPGGSQPVSLTGVAVSTTSVVVDPTLQDFGGIVVDEKSSSASFTVTNNGAPNTGEIVVSLVGANADQFKILTNNCSALIQTASCVVTVDFEPTSAGVKSAALQINAASGNMLSVALSATAIEKLMISDADEPFPALPGSIVAVSHDFGTGYPAKATDVATREFVVSCTAIPGARTCGPLVVAVSDMTNFKKIADTCNGMTLNDGDTCAITIDFEPQTSGAKVASLTVTGGAKEIVSAALSGAAVSPLALALSETACSAPAATGRDFGDTLVGSSDCAIYTVTYVAGSSTIPATSPLNVVLGGDNVDQFAVTASTCSGTVLNGGDSCSVTVSFIPTSLGAKTGSLTVSGALTGETASRSFTGTAVVGASLGISAGTNEFGGVVTGGMSAPFNFTVTNTGGLPTAALAVAFNGNSNFTKTADTCNGVALAVGAPCTITVVFAPPAGSGPGTRTGSLSVSGGGAAVSATLSGSALSPVGIVAAMGSGDFGAHPRNTNTDKAFTISNTGTSAIALTAELAAGSDQFSILSNDCPNPVPMAGTCTVTVRYSTGADTSAASHTGTLRVTGVNVNLTVALTGMRQAEPDLAWAVQPISLDFGTVWLGTTGASKSFTVTNTGGLASGALMITLPTDFAQTGGNCTTGVTDLAPTQSCTIEVALKPAAGGSPGNRSGDIQVVPASGNAALGTGTLTLAGVAAGTTQLIVTPSAVDFGTVVQGTTDAPVTLFTVANPNGGGMGTLTFAPSDPQFVVVPASTTCTTTLAPNATCVIGVRFAPTSAPGTLVSGDLTVSDGLSTARPALSGKVSQVAVIQFQTGAATYSAGPLATAFGPIVLGTSAMQTVTVTNRGDQATSALTVALGAPEAGIDSSAHYMLSANTCAGATLATGQSCSYVISFIPTNVGEKLAAVRISGTTGGALRNDLSGTALAQAAISISPDPVDPVVFGTAPVTSAINAAPQVQTFTVTNNGGSVPTGPLAFSVSDPNFFISGGTCVQGGTLSGNPAGSCTIDVQLRPSAISSPNPINATVNVTSTPGGMADAKITGISVSAFTATGGAVGPVVVGSSGTTTVTVTNSSDAVATSILSTTLGANQFNEFAIVSDACAAATLAPGASCDIVVGLVPNSLGAKTATLRVFQNGAVSDVTVTLTGTGVVAP